jgi:hypothetical protein
MVSFNKARIQISGQEGRMSGDGGQKAKVGVQPSDREAEDVAREYEGRGINAQRMQEALDETEQIKGDFLQILNFKNELEVLIEE